MVRSPLKAYSSAIAGAALSRKSALQVELAVGFAVMLESGPSKRLVRAVLCEVYASAGYKCREPSDIDWTSINRRITASLALYEFLGEAEIRKWAGESTRGELLSALVKQLEPLKLATVNEVLLICNRVKPAGRIRGPRPGTHIDTEHIHVVVPPNATSDELLLVASKLMAIASSMSHAAVEEPEAVAA